MLHISLLQINPKISLKDLRQELVFTPELQITARIDVLQLTARIDVSLRITYLLRPNLMNLNIINFEFN